jgi:polyisoprenoid-binding protein YceI
MNAKTALRAIGCSFFFLWAMWGTPATAQPLWEVVAHKLEYRILNAGVPFTGSFDSLELFVRLDTAVVPESNILARVPVLSIQTSQESMSQHLMRPSFFDAEQYPEMTLASRKMDYLGNGAWQATFAITIKGVTKSLPAQRFRLNPNVQAPQPVNLVFELRRKDFGIGSKAYPGLSNKVQVKVDLMLKPVFEAVY